MSAHGRGESWENAQTLQQVIESRGLWCLGTGVKLHGITGEYEKSFSERVTLIGASNQIDVYRLEGGDYFLMDPPGLLSRAYFSRSGIDIVLAHQVEQIRLYAHPAVQAVRAVLLSESRRRRSVVKTACSNAYLLVKNIREGLPETSAYRSLCDWVARRTALGSLAINFWWRLVVVEILAYAGGALYGAWSAVAVLGAGVMAVNLAGVVLRCKKPAPPQ